MLATPDQQTSLTDPDARSMATSGGGSGVVGYNLQTAVGTKQDRVHARLQLLCDEGLLARQLYQQHPPRYVYAATQQGRDLWPVLLIVAGIIAVAQAFASRQGHTGS